MTAPETGLGSLFRSEAATAGGLRPLGYSGGVRLSGPLAERLDQAVATYTSVPVANVLKGFRRQAGLPAPGEDLTGWSAGTTEATFGQWVSGFARLGAVLDDEGLRQRAVELVDGWAETLPADGDAAMATYGWEKIAYGLVDVATWCGHPEALRVLERIVDAAARTFDRSRSLPSPTDRDGRRPRGTPEWYTLAEPIYRGAMAGADAGLADFARLWHYDAYWDRFTTSPAPGRPWDVPVWRHAYSHVNTFASVGALQAFSGDASLLDVLRNAYDWATSTQTYATGGYGPGEWSVPDDGSLGRALETRTDTAEITCGTWAAFKLTTYLLTATGQARHLDWAERSIYSGIGATVPVRHDGRTPYYADYRLNVATKLPHWDAWPCCSGSYLQNVAHLADLVYFAAHDGLAVALFLPSEVSWRHDDEPVTVRQQTSFPTGDISRLRVIAARPVRLALRIRVPGWAQGFALSVNGEQLPGPWLPGTWAVIERTWSPEDELVVTLGTVLRAEAVDRFHPRRVALLHGPVVLAQDAVFSAPFTTQAPLDVVDLDRLLVRTGESLSWGPTQPGAAEQPVGTFRPLSEFAERAPYRIYHDTDIDRIL